jgi:hypothetical protein
MKKKTARCRNEEMEDSVISSGVLPISHAKRPNPKENKIEETSELAQGPYKSITWVKVFDIASAK